MSAASALVYAVSTLAIAADGQFVFSDDRSSVKVEVRDMPLGEVLRRLLDNIPAHIQWGDSALEKQPTTGKFSGPIADVVRQVLRGTDFMIAYSGKDTVARVIVLSKSGKTVAVGPGVVVVPAPPPHAATPQQTAQPAVPLPQTARPAEPAYVPNPLRRSHDM